MTTESTTDPLAPLLPTTSLPAELLWRPPAPLPKFRHPYGRHLLFFALTFFTTTFTQAFAYLWLTLGTGTNPFAAFTWTTFEAGLWYSIPLLIILSAHEFGHYFACRYHNVDATLPYFIPAPLPLTGTLGAVIRIREAFPSTRALFDIGVAGPIAGFVALLPFLYWGITMSQVARIQPNSAAIYFGEPLLWKAFEWLHFGTLPDGVDVVLHPMGFAAWWGMLATALNLLPFSQLDGGHIMYANLGRRATLLSAITLAVVVALTLQSASWLSMAVMMVIMAFIFGFRHPRVLDEHEPLDRTRRLVSILALLIFILCFTPVPIDTTPH